MKYMIKINLIPLLKKMYKKLKVITIAGTRPELIRLSQIIKNLILILITKLYTLVKTSQKNFQNFSRILI